MKNLKKYKGNNKQISNRNNDLPLKGKTFKIADELEKSIEGIMEMQNK